LNLPALPGFSLDTAHPPEPRLSAAKIELELAFSCVKVATADYKAGREMASVRGLKTAAAFVRSAAHSLDGL